MSGRTGRALRMSYVVASVGGVAFFVMSVALLGVWPQRVLEAETRAMSPEHPLGSTESERRGRAIYGREGCAYCHTQQIRYLHTDMSRFGAPTLAWETRLDYPHLWGTRRIGPDLSRAGGTRFAGLAVRAPLRPAFGRVRVGDAGVPGAVRRRARSPASGGARSGRVPRLAGPRPRDCRARRRGARASRMQLPGRRDEADGVRGAPQSASGEGAATRRRALAAGLRELRRADRSSMRTIAPRAMARAARPMVRA